MLIESAVPGNEHVSLAYPAGARRGDSFDASDANSETVGRFPSRAENADAVRMLPIGGGGSGTCSSAESVDAFRRLQRNTQQGNGGRLTFAVMTIPPFRQLGATRIVILRLMQMNIKNDLVAIDFARCLY